MGFDLAAPPRTLGGPPVSLNIRTEALSRIAVLGNHLPRQVVAENGDARERVRSRVVAHRRALEGRRTRRAPERIDETVG